MKTIDVINDWRPETTDLLKAVIDAGFKIVECDNGEEKVKFYGKLSRFVDEVIATDEAHVFLLSPEGEKCWIYIVLGNEPGVMASDLLDKVIDAHHQKWELKGQPKARGYYQAGKWVDAV